MTQQSTSAVLMVRPYRFRKNEQTADTNYYQKDQNTIVDIDAQVKMEFDTFAGKLKDHGIEAIVYQDDGTQDTPDSVFPNNWISTHEDGLTALYPMMAVNRRYERKEEIIDFIEGAGFVITEMLDYTEAEDEELFLEGTGSLIIDRNNAKVYCSLSPRADEELVLEFCEDMHYDPVLFTSYQSVNGERLPIYHTNVMMSVGTKFAVVCADSIDDKKERKAVLKSLKEDGKEIILLTERQIEQFAGNILELQSTGGETIIAMSTRAWNAYTPRQQATLEKFGTVVHSPLTTIEDLGGGSARCMLAEIFLPKK